MAKRYLLPEDVSADDAGQVLQFLNHAESARIIAEAVEFPDERDVGARVAERIVQRRAQLGQFHTLDELYAVPYVGPSRFTQIVVSLSSARPPSGASLDASWSELVALQQRIDSLKALLSPSVEARIWSLQDTFWLGQEASVLVQLRDAEGSPLADYPVTVTTSWGELVVQEGMDVVMGSAAVVRTSAAGIAELRLRAQFSAPLSELEQTALAVAADELPLAAPWPTEASAELRTIARRYRTPGSESLREAIDVAQRDYGRGASQPERRGHALAEWALVPINLVCFVNGVSSERGARQLAVASHLVAVRNWIPALLAAFEDEVAADTRLPAELARAPKDAKDAAVFLNDVFVSLGAFMNTEQGELGQAVRARVAQQQLQQFFQTDVAKLSPQLRLPALAGTSEASKTIGNGGLTLFDAVETSHRDLEKTTRDLGIAVGGRLTAVEHTVGSTPQLESRLSALEHGAASSAQLESRLRVLESSAATVRQLDGRLSDLAREVKLMGPR